MKKISLVDINTIYEKEIRKNVKNKKKLISFEKNKMSNLKEVKDVIESNKKEGYLKRYRSSFSATFRMTPNGENITNEHFS